MFPGRGMGGKSRYCESGRRRMVCCGWRRVGVIVVVVVGSFGRQRVLMLVLRIGRDWMSEIWPIRD